MLWPEGGAERPVFRNRRFRIEVDHRDNSTPYGGVALAHRLAAQLELDKQINRRVGLLKINRPYFESDHILTHVYNQYVGGQCIEDIANLQHSEAVKSLLGACRIPDPSTAGDFLRRFHESDLCDFQRAIDAAREKVWSQLPSHSKKVATIDLDSTVKEVHGECKQGAEFSYNGKWSYHPLLATLSETNEILRTINRPGNSSSAIGSAEVLSEVLPMVNRHFREVRVRGDSKFYQRAIISECEKWGANFVFTTEHINSLHDRAELLPERAWRPFDPHPEKRRSKRSKRKKRRCKRERSRRRIARRRRYETLTTTSQHVAELVYALPHQRKEIDYGMKGNTYRMVVKRQRVETHKGENRLFDEYQYRFFITNIGVGHMNASEVVRFCYGRCDQENTIEQTKNGVSSMRMPTGELLANGAFLMCGQLAWCLRSWLSLLSLPKETIRWEWKWFRQAFVYVSAKVVRAARGVSVRLSAAHRYAEHLVIAHQRIESFAFP